MVVRSTWRSSNDSIKVVYEYAQPPMETFMKIAKLLEVDINELLRFDELEIPQNKD